MVQFERFLEAILSDARREGCPPRLGEAIQYAVFPVVRASVRALRWLWPRPVVRRKDRSSRVLLRPSNSCTAPRWCTTICLASMMPRSGAASPPSHGLWRAAGGPRGRCADRARLRNGRAACGVASHAHGGAGGHSRRSRGTRGGIVAGQAWEAETSIDLARYHQAKTGALFAGATMAGATAAAMPGHRGVPWARSSVRPFRSRMIFATWPERPAKSASLRDRMPFCIARILRWNWA